MTEAWRVPFNRPSMAGLEADYMGRAVQAGHISGGGGFTRACHAFLERELGVCRAFLTTSCTHALEMSAVLLDIRPGDEVILPSFTFVSTANAFVLRGARPLFVDVRPDTLNLDERRLREKLTSRTKAIVAMHYAGVACEMETIVRVAGEAGVSVVEDNAHGLFARYRGRPLGTFGRLAAQSFHETKNFTCGEGGALLVNDPSLVDRAEIVREKGTNRSRFFRGEVDRYTWTDIGSSWLPSDLLAAFLLAQLERREAIQAARHRIWNRYAEDLSAWASREGVSLPVVPASCEHPAHLFHLLLPDLASRTAFIAHMRARRILTAFHYQALHLSEMGARFGGRPGDCPVAESASDRLVRLPLFYTLEEWALNEVIAAVTEFHA